MQYIKEIIKYISKL